MLRSPALPCHLRVIKASVNLAVASADANASG